MQAFRKHGVNPPKVEHVEMVQVKHNVGTGGFGDPIREVMSYYRKDGTHLFTIDPSGELLAANLSEMWTVRLPIGSARS